jgi:hypothetical protein
MHENIISRASSLRFSWQSAPPTRHAYTLYIHCKSVPGKKTHNVNNFASGTVYRDIKVNSEVQYRYFA